MSQLFPCGPIEIALDGDDCGLHHDIRESLSFYDVLWTEPRNRVELALRVVDSPTGTAEGNYLVCARMQVDATEDGLYAVCRSGASCSFRTVSGAWLFDLPRSSADGFLRSDIDDLLQLVLTTSWRRLGWVPLHAGALTNGKSCLLLCAPSGVGKTTLSVALLRRGWKILNDDKLLLRFTADRGAEVGALSHVLNLHPGAARWFPEIGDLTKLPAYSGWSEKRRVDTEAIWPGTTTDWSRPTDLVHLSRGEGKNEFRLSPLTRGDVLSILLRQTVIPNDKQTAGQILDAVAATASALRGWKMEIGADAYADSECLARLEEAVL